MSDLEPLLAAHEQTIARVQLPTLLLHGERDQLIPFSDATGIHDLLGVEDRRLVVIPGAGHNDILWWEQERYFHEIGAFARRLSRAASAAR
jgi:pimeloyl-ACP methyl ester carboxylesterase